ncbi:MAG: indole-3-glycerol phosphate synthase TrpC [Saprospiraceae bacterium]|nr:indole-3-glycerol phosphate synthase TrpC [Saprospiraceae bacterium]
MNILEKIITTKRKEVAERKQQITINQLEQSPFYCRSVISMVESLRSKAPFAIIAEFKRRSPSKGDIFAGAEVEPIVKGYAKAGCAGISILTDETYFGGHLNDLMEARTYVQVPLLRKEFIIDEFQILEAKAAGADLILLIAEVLTEKEVLRLAEFSQGLGLEVLLEMHTESQIDKINDYVNIVGINNRNLKTFEVDLEASIRLLHKLNGKYLRVSESGLSDPANVIKLADAGFDGFLVGENFMKSHRPGEACSAFIQDLLNYQKMKP